jgi:hypothetical protein
MFYSLRRTYISMRLMGGADIYQIAKDCRTGVEMVEDFYCLAQQEHVSAPNVNLRARGGAARRREDRPEGRRRRENPIDFSKRARLSFAIGDKRPRD